MRSESTDSTLSPGPDETAGTRRAARMAAVCAGWWRTWTAWWQGRPRAARDRELAFVLTVLSFAEPLASVGARFSDLPPRHAPVLAVLLALGQTLPLAVRANHPALCLTLVGLSFGVHQSLGLPQTFASMGLYLALYSVGAHAERGRRLLVVPAVMAYAALSVVLHARGAPQPPQDYVVIGLVLAAPWGGGAVVRGRRAAEAERRRLVAVAATAAERSRLARELHDVVTHHVTAMVVQSDAAPFLMASPERVTESLAAISGTGRRALAELRYLLGVLEATGESAAAHGAAPMPDAAPGGSAPGRSAPDSRAPARGDLRDLVEQTRRGGQPVDLVEEGKRLPLPIGADLTVYRLVQESLTNAVKYASGRATRVTVGYGHEHVDVEVANDGPDDHARQGIGDAHGDGRLAPPRPHHVSGGRGLGGLRERVRMLGGDFTAGPRADGGFSVRARIPTGGDA
ncbi:sensor histidine kinase [Streptomyces rapamycinicus]|uniref:histidine kinase n=1 Tax=Streptomyces rapamycinicus TaxID=1226757 RepID=A0ABR6M3J0_9ACTN|nr:histidine kinase [Streptomyces rapamycinicus]MBB4789175.1 signal transduction histidine kinase [Streptomyces rapamycinicus]UTO67367.1 histidine kinase [Streptomyces rapamycinicus]UTP35323.1 histidine kinase [Streptomyces rapamycinicus NRRL 5491]